MKLTKDQFKILLWDYLSRKLKKDKRAAKNVWNWIDRNLK